MNKLLILAFFSLMAYAANADTKIPVKGLFNMPLGTNSAGPATPGNTYDFDFVAQSTDKVTFASMVVQSNDWFIAPSDRAGIHPHNLALIEGSNVDITELFTIFDAGTEMDQAFGMGSFQAPRQSMPNEGPADSKQWVREADTNLLISDLVQIMLKKVSGDEFLMTIHVKSAAKTPLSPGAWIVFSQFQNPLFTTYTTIKAKGLEALAESGDPKILFTNL